MNEKYNKTINVYNSIKTNLLTWIVIFVCVFIISYPNITNGIITFLMTFVYSYLLHKATHIDINLFSIAHHYHHDAIPPTIFSTIIELIAELGILSVCIPLWIIDYIWNVHLINEWVVLFFTLLYISVHNINYSILHVNNSHKLHHENVYTNIGPDFCDILFQTKHPEDDDVENMYHYIINLIICAVVILFFQYLCKNEYIKYVLLNIFSLLLLVAFLYLNVSSTYILKCVLP